MGLKSLVDRKEDIELAYGEASLTNEKRLMVKVLKAIRAINNIKRNETYQYFGAVSHHEISILGRVFRAWKTQTEDTKSQINKEKEYMSEIKYHMNIFKKRQVFKLLRANQQEQMDMKYKYVQAMKHYDTVMMNKLVDML